jgi:hypothetical protein
VKQELVKFEVRYRGKPYDGIFSVVSGRVLVSLRLGEDLWSQACACFSGSPLNLARRMALELLTKAEEAEELPALGGLS